MTSPTAIVLTESDTRTALHIVSEHSDWGAAINAIAHALAATRTTAHAAGRLEALEEAQRKFGVYAMKYPAGRAWEMLEKMKKEER